MRRDEVGQRSETVRRANLSAIVRELHAHGPRSRSELVVRTGLTRSTIRALIGELVAAGLVSEARAAPLGTPGRPSPIVRLNADRAVVLALEIDVDSLAVAVVGLGGEVLDRWRIDRQRDHTSVEAVAGDLAELAAAALARAGNPDGPIGIGVAVVGVVRRSDGLVSMAPNLGWRTSPSGSGWPVRCTALCPSRSPTRPISAPSPSSSAAPPWGRTTCSTSRARWGWAVA